MIRFSQADPRWRSLKLGKTPFTIGRWGCTVTAICMIFSKFHKKSELTPDKGASLFSFDKEGRILWAKSNFGMKWEWRGYGFDKAKIEEYTKDRYKAAIVEVDGYHWCAVWQWLPVVGPVLFDPIDGTVLWNWKKRYKEITGYSLFKK